MSTTTVEPPAEAVAKDAHWAATQARLAGRRRPTSKLTICDDDDVKRRLARAQMELNAANARTPENPDDTATTQRLELAQSEFAAAQAAYDNASIVLTFQALPRPEFEALKKAHPPTEEQAEDGQEFDPESLAPALIAAASMDGMPEDDARHYLDTWGPAEAVELYNAAWSIQHHSRMDLGKG